MKKYMSIFLVALAGNTWIVAQDPIAYSSVQNTVAVQQDSIMAVITVANPMTIFFIQDSIIITSNPVFMSLFAQEDTATFLPALDRIEGIRIYPNPTYDRLTLQKEKVPYALNIELYDTQGSLLNIFYWHEEQVSIEPNISSLPPGIYFIRVSNEEYTAGNTYKVMKR